MSKKKEFSYRWRLSNGFEIGETESWLSDLAAEGLHLDRVGFGRFRFRRGEPQKVRYRVDMELASAGMTEEEQRRAYEEYGWEYAGRLGDFRLFRSPEDLNAPELHTDPAEQAYTLVRLEKKLTRLAICVVAASVAVIAMLCAVWFMGEAPTLRLVRDEVLQQVFLLTVYIFLIGISVWQARSIRGLCRALREGRPVDHRADWKKSRRRAKAAMLVMLILEIPVLATPLIHLPQTANPRFYSLPTDEDEAPFIQLADIEKEPQRLRREEAQEENRFQNRYTKEWGIFAAAIYETAETAQAPGKQWPDASGPYEPSLTSELYQLRFPGLAKRLALERIQLHDNVENVRRDGGNVEEWRDGRFDVLVVAQNETRTEVAAARGKEVIWLRYYGLTTAEEIVEAVAEKLAKER